MEDSALQVLEAVQRTQAELADKEGELNAIREEFDKKKKEVRAGLGRVAGGRGRCK